MLILTRKTNEAIKIADDTEVVVLSVKGDRVRIGINAPMTIPVHRSEIYHKIKLEAENQKKPADLSDDEKLSAGSASR